MKPWISIACLWLLVGCAPTVPFDANLNLSVTEQLQRRYPEGTAASLQGHDGRDYPEIARYTIKNDPAVAIPNRHPPQLIVSEHLAIGFREQGLVFEHQAPVHLLLEIDELLASVTKPKVLYDISAVSAVSVTVTGSSDSLTKRYRKESTRVTVTRPELEDLESLLNEQLSRIVQQILDDEEIRKLIISSRK
ncbi:MAG: hypothetical protein IH612_11235 [Desulfofustis sp.]|nr:hypothetical protein [Desulfofustis sp.]